MPVVIAIANQKGGVGKTTSVAALGVVLSRMGERVHLIDMDPQSNLTSSFGFHDPDGSLYDALRNETELPLVRLDDRLTLTPSSADLARGEAEFLSEPAGSQFFLQAALGKTELPADTLVLVDCPPSLGVLGINCLTAADRLLVAVHPGKYELDGLKRLQKTVDRLTEKVNPNLLMLGLLLTNCDNRKKITRLVLEKVSSVYSVLGLIRGDAQLQYACGDGTLLYLKVGDSHALREYEQVGEKIRTTVWQTAKART